MARTYFDIPAYDGPLSRHIRNIRHPNPKRGKSALRYALYREDMTVRDYQQACESLGEKHLALFDITWDTDPKRRFIELFD